MSGVLKHTVVVRNPDTYEAVALIEGEPVPDWAKDLVHADDIDGKPAAKSANRKSS